jgi:hypothetical protein
MTLPPEVFVLSDVCMFACQPKLCLIKVSYCLILMSDKAGAVRSFSETIVPSSLSARYAGDCILADTDTNTGFVHLMRLGFALIHGEHAVSNGPGRTIVHPIR